MVKQQRTLIPFLVFSFPKCVSGKILLSLDFLIIKKHQLKNQTSTNQKLYMQNKIKNFRKVAQAYIID